MTINAKSNFEQRHTSAFGLMSAGLDEKILSSPMVG